MTQIKFLSLSLFFWIVVLSPSIAQKTAFTTEDALRVKSLSSQTLSDNGKYLGGMIMDGSARFDTDHFRFQDPSYLNVFPGELVIINTEDASEIRPYAGTAKITSLAWAPNNTEIAFLEEKEDKLHLMIYNVDRKKLKEVSISGNPLIANSDLTWTPDSKSVLVHTRESSWLGRAMEIYNEATNGPTVVYDGSKPFLKWDEIRNTNSLTEVHQVNLSNGKASKLLPESNYNGIYIAADGKHLIFNEVFPLKTAYERNKGTEYQTAYLNLITQDTAKVIYPRNEKRRNFTWTENKSKYAWVDSGYVYIQTLGEDNAKNLTKGKAYSDEEKKKEVKFSIMTWSPSDGKLLLSSEKGYWLTDTAGDQLEMIYELLEDKEKAPSLDLINWSEDERYLFFNYSSKEKWERGFTRFDLEAKQMEDVLINSNLYTNVQKSKDGSKYILSVSDGDMPSNVMSTDASFSNMKSLTDLNPWMSNKNLTRSELISYRDMDGKELKGVLYYPVDYEPGKKYPLVCEVYETFFDNGYNRNMNLIANQGYFALRPSVDLELGYPGEAWVKGINSVINKLVDEGKVDNDKVGVHGVSYGGYATSLLITQTDRFAAAINISGKVNIISFLGDSPKIGTRNYAAAEVGQDRIGGSLWDDPLKYFATTAVLHADRIKTPHLILTGEGDWNVPGTNSRELYYAMRRLGKEVVWVNYLKGGHGAGWASGESDFHDQWKRIFDFYEKQFSKEKEKEKGEDSAN
ncbi:MAG: prolyl oligopeptidase family serine peptidase [Algoriphagus sp.]|uniref:alpha/beta hydrolase family protein n=1 Tax=Algoriphagus sp. TaxID=1872435 RepID=UPI00260ACF28|nr:prolyl oligopeptidase family serine peptidase [Algoriphagus sp.]MDG1278543.1 prolyl oligopeptidase family serine peptidase [Algoriphagus sp.]